MKKINLDKAELIFPDCLEDSQLREYLCYETKEYINKVIQLVLEDIFRREKMTEEEFQSMCYSNKFDYMVFPYLDKVGNIFDWSDNNE